MTEIVVLGSLNYDLVVTTPRTPGAGETLLAHDHRYGYGGKGANQAVAAARLGARVSFVGSVGIDQPGIDYISLLQHEGIATEWVSGNPSVPTGHAVVIVEESGQNRILVSPGSNGHVTAVDVDAAADALTRAQVVLAQLEVPAPAVQRAFEIAQGTRILNAAPALEVPQDLLDVTDLLIVNESELAALTGDPEPQDPDQAILGAQKIRGPKVIVVTLGAQGAIAHTRYQGQNRSWHQPGLVMDVVDTTAAGDAFCGALAVELGLGNTLDEALQRATEVSALVVTKPGALDSLPTRYELHKTFGGWTQ